jgi:hypothetical protein
VSELGDRLIAVHDALTAAGVPHAIGGAIALGYCTFEPRATRDLDVNVFVGPERVKEVFAALPPGVAVSGLSLERAERDGQVRLWWDQTPVDVFFSTLAFHAHAQSGVREVSFEGHAIPVLSCTALAVFKALFDRTRDWGDIESMVEAGALDFDEAIRWVSEMAGPESDATQKLTALRA